MSNNNKRKQSSYLTVKLRKFQLECYCWKKRNYGNTAISICQFQTTKTVDTCLESGLKN